VDFTDADLAGLLDATGDLVTLGATTVSCVIHAADVQQLQVEGAPMAVISKALSVTVKTGALVGLATGATVLIKGATYKVDAVARFANGQLTRFLAFLLYQELTKSLGDSVTLADGVSHV
jgi:hypothetical protein